MRVACFGFCFCHLFRLLFLHHFRTLSTHICKQVRQSLAQLSAMKHTRSPAAFPSPYAHIHRHCHTLDTHVHTHVITIANSESQNTRISAHNSQINSVTHNATPPLRPYIPKPCSPPHPAHRSFSTFWVIISALLSITNDWKVRALFTFFKEGRGQTYFTGYELWNWNNMGKFKKSNINYIRSQYYSEKEENQGPYLIFIILFLLLTQISNTANIAAY